MDSDICLKTIIQEAASPGHKRPTVFCQGSVNRTPALNAEHQCCYTHVTSTMLSDTSVPDNLAHLFVALTAQLRSGLGPVVAEFGKDFFQQARHGADGECQGSMIADRQSHCTANTWLDDA